MENLEKDEQARQLESYIEAVKSGVEPEIELHESDIAEILTEIKKEDPEKFYAYLTALPPEVQGDTFLELPDKYQDELSKELSAEDLAKVVNELDTDDATDMVQKIEENDAYKAQEVLSKLEEEQMENVKSLKLYKDNQAGSFMQVELFSATLDETIAEALKRLKKMKLEEEVENIHYVFIVDHENRLVGHISLEDLIIIDFDKTFRDIMDALDETISVRSTEELTEVSNIVEKYNLTVLPVVDNFNHLLGRITPDDLYDIIEENATDQIYSLANVNVEEELEDSVIDTGKSRAYWLFVNLITAVIASVVIGMFADTIDSLVALAVLMPIVASMGGIAGTQTMTVVVRQLALGEVDFDNSREILKKEILVSLFNGLIFSAITTLLAYLWFGLPMLGAVMAAAIFINLMFAGFFGAGIPLLLKKVNIDPAVASGVLLTTVTDVVGFFTFLGLATLLIL